MAHTSRASELEQSIQKVIEALRVAIASMPPLEHSTSALTTTTEQQFESEDSALNQEIELHTRHLARKWEQLRQALASRRPTFEATSPFVLPPGLQATRAFLQRLLALCNAPEAARLDLDSDSVGRELARRRPFRIIRQVFGHTPRHAAERAADRWAFPNTKQWHERYAAAIREHAEVWNDAKKEVLHELDAVRQQEHALRQEHEADLEQHIATELQSEFDETVRLVESATALLQRATQSTSREKDLLSAALRPWQAAESLYGMSRRTGVALSPDDRRLAAKWAAGRGSNFSYWTGAMESARRAERVACELYSELYGAATDLSISQLWGSDTRWKVADIDTGGRLIDVKNARRSFSSPDSYSEFCVPQFKIDRSAGKDVTVSAFLSPYSAPREDEELAWLGETTMSELRHLSNVFSSEHLDVDLAVGTQAYLPPWVFDYPPECYIERDAAIVAIRAPSAALPRVRPIGAEVLAARARGEARDDIDFEAEMLAQTLHRFDGPRRPALFLHVLDRFCSTLKNGRPFPQRALHELLFASQAVDHQGVEARWTLAPLATCDPLATIGSLIRMLDKVAVSCTERAEKFTSFRLVGPRVLKGGHGRGPLQTIFAYCGGWRLLDDGRRVRCGLNPLYLGQDAPCCICRKLVCHVCGFCTRECAEYHRRCPDAVPVDPLGAPNSA